MNEFSYTPTSLGFRPVAKFISMPEINNSECTDSSERITTFVYEDETSCNLFQQSFPGTYMWIKKGTNTPLYIGQASKGIKERAKQHVAGFYGTTKARRVRNKSGKETAGLAHARRILEILNCRDGENELEWWVRPSDYINIFDGSVSLAPVEECRFIEMFNPPWNFSPKR